MSWSPSDEQLRDLAQQLLEDYDLEEAKQSVADAYEEYPMSQADIDLAGTRLVRMIASARIPAHPDADVELA